MPDLDILQVTGDVLENLCDDEMPEFEPLDVLVTLLCYAQRKQVLRTENSKHDAIASHKAFFPHASSVIELATSEQKSDRARYNAWMLFIQVAISELRGPAFPQTRFFSVTNGDEQMLVEIDDIALRIVEEIRTWVASREGNDTGEDVVTALTKLGTQLKAPRDVSFATAQLWNKFLNRTAIPAKQQQELTAELFRVVTHVVMWPALTPEALTQESAEATE